MADNDLPRSPAFEDDRLRARRERMSGRSGGRRGGKILTAIVLLAFLALAALVLFPEQAKRLLGFGTSESEVMQRTSTVDDSGISTIITPQPEITIETPAPSVVVVPPAADDAPAALSAEAAARIAALEAALKRLADRPADAPGPSATEIKALLDQQADALRAEAESREQLLRAQLEALRAANAIPTGPTAAELAEAERLRQQAEERARLRERLERQQAERRAKLEAAQAAREAELERRRLSDANVFDEGEEGTGRSGATDRKEGVRELTDNELFLKGSANSEGTKTVRAGFIGDVSRTIVQGTVISAVLETAIDTELPGNIRAQVSRPVYSYDGSEVLMQAGTRLIGSYNPKVAIAQKRVLIAWVRAITPEGRTFRLAAAGTDRLGRGGQAGNVDTRFVQRFGSAALISAIGAVPALASNGNRGASETTEAVTGAAGDVADDLQDASEDALEEYLKLPPVIRIPQGTTMRVLVNQDLDFT